VQARDAADHLDVTATTQVVQRTYTIMVGQRPTVALTEWIVPGRLAATTQLLRANGRAGRVGVGPEFVADL
jgi:hypothetical protein